MNDRRSPYEGNYIEALDISKPVKLIISEVVNEFQEKSADGRPIDRIILKFQKAQKGLILNKTNYRVMWAMFGKTRTDWIGKEIVLCRRYINAFGDRNVMCIRIWPPKGTPLPRSVLTKLGLEEPE